METNLQRDKHARLCSTVNQLIDELTPSAADFQLRDACDQLVSFLFSTPRHNMNDVITDGDPERSTGDAPTNGIFTRYAGHIGGSRGQMLSRCNFEAASDLEPCRSPAIIDSSVMF